jgi:hypothetical protein
VNGKEPKTLGSNSGKFITLKNADDLNVAMDGTTDTNTKGALFVDEYRHIKDWSSAFDLEISLPKCVEIVITKVRASKPLVVAELDDIKRVDIVKLLGINV